MIHRWRTCYGLSGLRGYFRPSSSSKPRDIYCRDFPLRCCRLPLPTICNVRTASTSAPLPTEELRQRRKDITPTADTIYALSTAPGRAAIAIIRISGPACLDIYGSLCPERPFPHPRFATLRKLKDPRDSTRVLDNGALILFFPSPNTVTGDDILELHVHGGTAVVRSVLEAIPHCADSRPRRRTADYNQIRAAEPGEFTKRAFYNGRLDLTQAEALGETLAAETEQQRRLAVAGADNRLADRYEGWRETLLYARGELEALIDFSEDQHFDESPVDFMHSISAQIYELNAQIDMHVLNASRGELLRNGISIALLGAPNAGKSSLLNQIVGRDAAIVSAEAGTTRDIVDVSVDIGGWLVRLGDMAGLRRDNQSGPTTHVEPMTGALTIGQVELEGIRRARERALQSDLVIVIISLLYHANGAIDLSINPELVDAVEKCHQAGKAMVYVVNKIDLLPTEDRFKSDSGLRQRICNIFPFAHEDSIFLLSCKDAASSFMPTFKPSSPTLSDPSGVQTFLTGLTQTFRKMTSAITESDPTHTSITNSTMITEDQSYWATSLAVTHRQSMYLQHCRTHLGDFLAQCTTPRVNASTLSISHHVDGHDDLVGEKVARQYEIQDGAENHVDIVTAAEHLRYAATCLAKITGRGEGGDVEDVLGVVFEK